MWKKKKFGGPSEITFLHTVSYTCVCFFHSRRLLVQSWRRKSVFSQLWFLPTSLFFPVGIYRDRGGKRSGCLKVCGRHVTCCTLLRLIFLRDPRFKSHSFDLFTWGLIFFPQLIHFRDVTASNKQTTTQKFKWGGGGGRRVKSVNKSARNSQHSHASGLSGPAVYCLLVFLCVWLNFSTDLFRQQTLATWTRIAARLRPGSRSCTSAGTRKRSWRPSSMRWWTPAKRAGIRPLCPWGWGNYRTPSSGSRTPGDTPDKYY